MKVFDIGKIKTTLHKNCVVKGFVIKRNVTVRECRYIFFCIFRITIENRNDCIDREEYKEYNEKLTDTLNKWLIGDADDSEIMEYAYDCSNEPLGLFNLLPLIVYLKKREVI